MLDLVLVLGFGLVYWVVGTLALVAVLLLSVLGISAKETKRGPSLQSIPSLSQPVKLPG